MACTAHCGGRGKVFGALAGRPQPTVPASLWPRAPLPTPLLLPRHSPAAGAGSSSIYLPPAKPPRPPGPPVRVRVNAGRHALIAHLVLPSRVLSPRVMRNSSGTIDSSNLSTEHCQPGRCAGTSHRWATLSRMARSLSTRRAS